MAETRRYEFPGPNILRLRTPDLEQYTLRTAPGYSSPPRTAIVAFIEYYHRWNGITQIPTPGETWVFEAENEFVDDGLILIPHQASLYWATQYKTAVGAKNQTAPIWMRSIDYLTGYAHLFWGQVDNGVARSSGNIPTLTRTPVPTADGIATTALNPFLELFEFRTPAVAIPALPGNVRPQIVLGNADVPTGTNWQFAITVSVSYWALSAQAANSDLAVFDFLSKLTNPEI